MQEATVDVNYFSVFYSTVLQHAPMTSYFWVAFGGAIGSVTRYWLSSWIAAQFNEKFPIGTLVVNVSGSFVIGFFATLTGPNGRWFPSLDTRIFFMSGICGGYTTFSTFSLQTLDLARKGDWLYAGLNAILSMTLCLVAVWLGHLAASPMTSKGN